MDRKTCLENLINDYLIETYPYIIGVCDISLSKINDRMSVHMIMKLNNQKVKNLIGNDLYGTIFSENKAKDLFSVRWFLKDYINLNMIRDEIKNYYKMFYCERIHTFTIDLELTDEGTFTECN